MKIASNQFDDGSSLMSGPFLSTCARKDASFEIVFINIHHSRSHAIPGTCKTAILKPNDNLCNMVGFIILIMRNLQLQFYIISLEFLCVNRRHLSPLNTPSSRRAERWMYSEAVWTFSLNKIYELQMATSKMKQNKYLYHLWDRRLVL